MDEKKPLWRLMDRIDMNELTEKDKYTLELILHAFDGLPSNEPQQAAFFRVAYRQLTELLEETK